MSRHNKSKRRRRVKSTAPQVPPRPPRRIDERPQRLNAPWHPFPLVELCVLAGIVCIVLGLFRTEDQGGRILLTLGLVLGSLGGLDTSMREHFAGYRSHTLVLAAFPAVATAALSAFAGLWLVAVVPLMLAVFALAFLALKRLWRRKTGVPA
ncbi:hypothetical protein DVA67_019770 [Solirubrobacter sp. CPCC 204708]|uniref:Uncharacterized protein n=1 Tax=Solirubrobacter deserti TaxID=2282478 RepID=A0ABT4RGK6_9ACTN|nr:hypothetical protein [Solirubrobacter deserti]MBE2318230.1 hypothetical protein [Solirubrobacter deserti]MDA0137511.1 hypothetical protein [Solirubrobacter deserti]